MHVLRLELEGIGPFAQRQLIDFEELSAGGLFLLEGPTGSGKTTIVDAIVFALYGDVAGTDSSKGRIVSTLLPSGVEPFIDLVVDTSHGLLRVRRVPEYERPSKRGTGVTINKASIKLWKLADLDDEGVLVSTNIQEANDELARAIGLSKAQFTQTVVLPQGQFATFLKSKPEDRRDVLQDIFGTELYERIATKLAESATGMRKAVEKAVDDVVTAAGNFCQLAWYDDDQQANEQIPEQLQFDSAVDGQQYGQLSALAELRLSALRERAQELDIEVKSAKAKVDQADARLGEVRDRNKAIAERDELVQRQRALVDVEAEVQRKAGLLELAERAEAVRHPLDEAEGSASEFTRLEAAMSDLAAATSSGPDSDLVARWQTAEQYERLQHEALTAAGQLDSLLVDEASLPQLESGLDRAESSLRIAGDDLEGRESSLENMAREVEAFVAEFERETVVAAVLPDALLAEAATASVRSAAEEAEQCRSDLMTLRGNEDELRATGKDVGAAYEAARRSWLGSLASTIAAELIDHVPCPVCGSEEHPAPAVPVAGLATRKDVEELDKDRLRAIESLQKAIEACNAMVARIEERSRAAKGLKAAEAEQKHAVAAELVRQSRGALQRAEEITRRLDRLRTDQKKESDQIVLLGKNLATRSEQARLQRESLEQLKVRVSLGCAGYRSVEERAQSIRDRARIAGSLATAQHAKSAAGTAMTMRAEALTEALRTSGFKTSSEVRDALVPKETGEGLRKVVEKHRQDCAVVAAALEAPRIASLGDASTQDTGAYELAKRDAEGDLEKRTLEQGELSLTISASAKAASAMSKAVTVHEQTALSALPVIRMAEVVNAQQGNELRMSLPTFVLLRRFEEVVDLANVRLNAMTDGRFELRRTDAKEGRGQKLGLGLEAIDHASSDATREPQTLSGGETFKASLAMALGLADAVTAEAGGVEMNTLFVDEGFGSLDPDSLDSVMDQLTKLRQGGRSVGVISHVAEMKQRIAERVSVRPIGDGTSQLTVVGSTLGLASQ